MLLQAAGWVGQTALGGCLHCNSEMCPKRVITCACIQVYTWTWKAARLAKANDTLEAQAA